MEARGPALVTGASRGIGRAVAIELAIRGFDVVATMRDPVAGADLPAQVTRAGAAGTLRVEALDVTRAGAFTMPDGLRVLVNNAALDVPNVPLEATDDTMWRAMFETNVIGLVDVTRCALPSLRAAGPGGVVCNITSISVVTPMPFFTVYRATKAAVSAIGESLRGELAPFGLRVLEVLPGPIDTDMLAQSHITPEAVSVVAYRPLAEKVGAVRAAMDGIATPPGDAARAIVDAIVDDASPLRVACDDIGSAFLDAWRTSSDEELAEGFLAAFTLD